MKNLKKSKLGHFKKSTNLSDVFLSEVVLSDFDSAAKLLCNDLIKVGNEEIYLTDEQKDEIWRFKVDYLLCYLSFNTSFGYLDVLPCLNGASWSNYQELAIVNQHLVLHGERLIDNVTYSLFRCTNPIERNPDGEKIKANLTKCCQDACLAPNSYSSVASFVKAIEPMLLEIHEHARHSSQLECLDSFNPLLEIGELEAYSYIHDMLSYGKVISAPAKVLQHFYEEEMYSEVLLKDVISSTLAKEFYSNASSLRYGDSNSLSWLNSYSPKIWNPESDWIARLKEKASFLSKILPKRKEAREQVMPAELDGVTCIYGVSGSGIDTSVLSMAAHSVCDLEKPTIMVLNDHNESGHSKYEKDYARFWLSTNFLNREVRDKMSIFKVQTEDDLAIASKYAKLYFMDYSWLLYCLTNKDLRKKVDLSKFNFVVQSLESELKDLERVIELAKSNNMRMQINLNGYPLFCNGADNYILHALECGFSNDNPFVGEHLDRRDLASLKPGEVIHFTKMEDGYSKKHSRNYYEMI